MPRHLQPHLQLEQILIHHHIPLVVIQGHQLLLHCREEILDQTRIARETKLEGVLNHQRQQTRGRNTAEDRPLETGGQQIG